MAKKKKSKTPYETEDARLIREEFDVSIRVLTKDRGPAIAQMFDLAGQALKRRKDAALTMMPEIVNRYGHYYLRESELKQDFVSLCSSFGHSVDGADSMYYMTLAAAIWMLDDLGRVRELEGAYSYFSPNIQEIEAIDLPDILDPCFDTLALQGMMELIQARDGNPEGYRRYINDKTARRRKPIEHQIADKDTNDMTPRERFNAVMSMIEPTFKERAVRRFEEKFWEFLDIYFSQISVYSNQESIVDDQAERMLQKAGVWLEEADEEIDITQFMRQSGPSVVRAKPSLSDFNAMLEKKEQENEYRNRILADVDLFQERCDDLEEKRFSVSLAMHLQQMEEADEEDNIDPDVLAAIQSFEIDDPYETCFAYLCLIESGSDLPWIYNAALGVLLAACRKFPWTVELEDDLPEDADDEEEENFESESDHADQTDQADGDAPKIDLSEFIGGDHVPFDWIERKAQLYRLNYTPSALFVPLEAPHPSRKVNLPQIIYALSGVVMPRDDWILDETAEDLVQDGMEPGFAQAMEYYLTLACDMNSSVRDWRHILKSSCFKEIQEEYGTDEKVTATDAEEQVAQLREELKQERDRNRELQQMLHGAQREAERQKQAAEAAVHTADAERAELANLRELIFQQANMQNADRDETEKCDISFPYSTVRKTVVFGGHDSWLKAIRPMLPDVTFVNREQNPNADMIRGADVVWIQPNALAHSMFYKIANIVRANHVPIRYFSSASARNCAMQVAESEVKDGLSAT